MNNPLRITATALVLFALCVAPLAAKSVKPGPDAGGITGSAGCRSCHEKFYQLWSTSFHGLAMRPYSDAFAKASLTPQPGPLASGRESYQAKTGPGQGFIEVIEGSGKKRYPIVHVLGGKNVFYFLTPLDKGRLQTLPLAYDVRRREWFDTAQSAVRHAAGAPSGASQALHWKDWPYAFNTACHGCHVSQFAPNYDATTGVYRTTWTEPGINCETCHGPGAEHVKVCLAAPKNAPPKDLKTIRGGRDFTPTQRNDLCASCHAKAMALTRGYTPGERFFDHFDLAGPENLDYYPDGRDLGENYTFTSWLRSPCVIKGQLDCMHCHTSSGRYKFAAPEKANQACLPCHAERVQNAAQHTRHPEQSPGNRCISCHMPMTEFARMRRSDHSMLPPTPAATLAFNSPNACNICHADKDAAWADQRVRSWRQRDYQAPVLAQAALIDAARRGDWTRLPEMVRAVQEKAWDAVMTAALVKLLVFCPDPYKWDAVIGSLSSPSPLVRAAAAESLANPPSPRAAQALALAAGDDSRLVRIRAATSLAGVPKGQIPADQAATVAAASREYLDSLSARPDLWTSQYNLGNYHLARGEFAQAAACYDQASRLDPASLPPLVNAAMAYSRMGDNAAAEKKLVSALALSPNDAASQFNLGLLRAEAGDAAGAEKHLRAALAVSPDMAEAAFNLGVLVAGDRPAEAIELTAKAASLRPDQPRYAYTQAFFLARSGDRAGAERVLVQLLARFPDNREAAGLLGQVRR